MEQLTKHITIGLTESKMCGIQISPDLDATEAFQLVGTLALHILNAYSQVAIQQLQACSDPTQTSSKNKKTKLTVKELGAATRGVKESMYDAMDSVFSNVLTDFYPDAARNTIEDEAILELVNKKIEQQYYALPPKEREAYKSAYKRTKAHLEKQLQEMQEQVGEDNAESEGKTESAE